MGQIINSPIKPLLSIKVEQQTNLTFYKMKFEFTKRICPLTKSDFESEEELATEPAFDFLAQQLNDETEFQKKVY